MRKRQERSAPPSAGTRTRSSGWQIAKRHYRIKLGDVLEAHEQSLEAFGGLPGICNLDSILGAIGRPYHGYHHTIHAKAAALLHGIATSHGFNDANKRTAWLAAEVLCWNSAYRLTLRAEDRIDDVVVDVVTGVMSQADLEKWFKARLSRESA
ncbi:type II toxin-antitoxin system death-on-curing family toxin [uncultured Roseobacter sp.]|uniref:type II toxin-antitoxin system death-on-curing family toxin n=1 Tax=uncultured Roseobacter sp. TaxID=114847 RepID=UPI0026019D57|nr:type II toxin-antitoxin system death-on-curing family toxin [uncultured Roseobacter sp.]